MGSLEKAWSEAVSGRSRGPGAVLLRGLLAGASGLYALGLHANLAVYRLGLKAHTRASLPVISVGNLTLGGTGKTLAVKLLAGLLREWGWQPGVVLRGHGRRSAEPVTVVSLGEGPLRPVAESGDEAAELALALPGVPVAVGKRREVVIERLREAGAQVALLDDGYQYFRMRREANIVLLSARMDLRAARLFPRGTLRDPWSELRRADLVIITHADEASADALAALAGFVARYGRGVPVLHASHAPGGLRALGSDQTLPLSALRERQVVAVSGLGDPTGFERTLATLGAQVTPLAFPDHHEYTHADVTQITSTAQDQGALLVTTGKDAVKLGPLQPEGVWVLDVALSLSEADRHALRQLISEKITHA